ncbi:hypothetical protein [Bacteroides faecis]|uniref:hypothetical protein n=1 Tax=Bacteroides faecis TaxID=674529 RepID=UPI002164EF3B|nr:hypothetical protein [Bacteroides faecis]MCS2237059.1 hypothetical protein [Bacteroides faecis]MCS2937676.1 hypothetical protein [Bacteroides faecis]MCS3069601.1 hypothetical protein [Bacteroides faecis]UVS48203.1 hypothetical protein NXW99_23420 [Bacteroides faecis]
MPKDTKTLGNNKARACESLGFVHKKGCASVLTQPLVVSQSKVFVTLGISFSLWQSYIFVLTFLTKPYE